jgi:hypothetical protein
MLHGVEKYFPETETRRQVGEHYSIARKHYRNAINNEKIITWPGGYRQRKVSVRFLSKKNVNRSLANLFPVSFFCFRQLPRK